MKVEKRGLFVYVCVLNPVSITWDIRLLTSCQLPFIAMPLLRKKDPHSIPPVSPATYVASRNPYNASPMNRSSSHIDKYTEGEDQYATDRYPHSRGVPDAYTRGEADLEQDRNALLSGYKPQKPGGSGRFPSGPDIGHPKAGEETEEDIEGIKQQTQFMKQESVKTTRNAIRMAREAEETAMNTLGRLGDQSGMLEFCLTTTFIKGLQRG